MINYILGVILLLISFHSTAQIYRYQQITLGSTSSNVLFSACDTGSACSPGQANLPSVRYNQVSNLWDFSNDGVSYFAIGSVDYVIAGLALKENLLVNSAGLRSALSDETGSGLAVFGTAPTISNANLTGVPVVPTAAAATSTTQAASTQFVMGEIATVIAGGVNDASTTTKGIVKLDGDLTGTALLPTIKSSVALSGSPTTTTQAAADSSTKIATTAFVTTADNLKANLASPTFTGIPLAPTAAAATSTTQLATTAFVTTADNLKQNLLTNSAGLRGALSDETGTAFAVFSDSPFLTTMATISNNASNPTPPSNTLLHIIAPNASTNRITYDVFGAVARYTGRRANGTAASPTGLVDGDPIVVLAGLGHNGTAYESNYTGGVQINAAETWAVGSNATSIQLQTTPSGSNTALDRMTVNKDGYVGINVTTPTTWLTIKDTFTGTASTGPNLLITKDATGAQQQGIDLNWQEDLTNLLAGEGVSLEWSAKLDGDVVNFPVASISSYKENGTDTSRLSSLIFSTSNDGIVAPTEKVRIFGDGFVNTYHPAHTAKTAATTPVTLTMAEIRTRLIYWSTATTAITLNMPTAASIETDLLGIANASFEFTIDNANTALGAITLGANGNTLLGANMTVAIGTSATFVCYRTGASAYTVYRK